MNGRLTLGLVIGLALLAGYIYLFELTEPDRPDPAAPIDVHGVTYGEYDIVGLIITGTERAAHFTRTDDSLTQDWQMVRPQTLTPDQVDQVRVNGAATRLGRLTAGQVITGVTTLAPYGLTPPLLTVTLTLSKGQALTLYGGDASPVADQRYLRPAAATDTIYLVAAFALDDLRSLLETPPLAPTPLPTITPRPTP